MAMSACNKQTQEEQKPEQFEDAFNTSQELQEKAVADSGFANSEEYRSQMENASIEMSKKTFNMNENEKMLLEFEVSLKKLKQYTDQLKQHPELSKDASFMGKVQVKAAKVRELQQSLKKVNLTLLEKEKFSELCHQ
ncbi:MAG: hypothetical protein LLF95_08475 [Bacteroidales bacterium]|nr:hypothetical protein [Bacteroidales bacterium]